MLISFAVSNCIWLYCV